MKRASTGAHHTRTPFDTLFRDAVDTLGVLQRRYGLSSHQVAQLASVAASLAADARAPTTVQNLPDILDVHIADSLAALDIDAVREASLAADIGSGAGFPGTALAVTLPACTVNLVESQARKAAHLRRLVELAAIENASVVERRVEEWTQGLGTHSLVTARALAPLAVVAEYAAPLLSIGGVIVDWRGRRDAEQERAAAAAAEELGLQRLEIRHVQPYSQAVAHHLHVYVKQAPTPERFPRRAGVARKRPLGQ